MDFSFECRGYGPTLTISSLLDVLAQPRLPDALTAGEQGFRILTLVHMRNLGTHRSRLGLFQEGLTCAPQEARGVYEYNDRG